MAIIHISGGSLSGGAFRSTFALHVAAFESGYNSKFYTIDKSFADLNRTKNVFYLFEGRRLDRLQFVLGYIFSRIIVKIFNKSSYNDFNYNFGISVEKILEIFDKDETIFIHWLGAGFKLKLKKPDIPREVIFVHRDAYFLTGGCHYTLGCTNFKNKKCGNCPAVPRFIRPFISRSLGGKISLLSKYKSAAISDSFFKVFFNTHKLNYENCGNLIESKWLLNRSQAEPQHQTTLLDRDKVRICVGANDLVSAYKGIPAFLAALESHEQRQAIEVHCFGKNFELLDGKYRSLNLVDHGYLDPLQLRKLLGSCDLYVHCAHEEAFGKVLVESVASGTPVVCFSSVGATEVLSKYGVCLATENDTPIALVELTLNALKNKQLGKNCIKYREEILKGLSPLNASKRLQKIAQRSH